MILPKSPSSNLQGLTKEIKESIRYVLRTVQDKGEKNGPAISAETHELCKSRAFQELKEKKRQKKSEEGEEDTRNPSILIPKKQMQDYHPASPTSLLDPTLPSLYHS
jgi:hypothetical protein